MEWRATVLLGVCVVLAIGALLVSGSVSHGVLELLSTGYRTGGNDTSAFSEFLSAFFRDITGTPGFAVSAIKFAAAVAVASGVVRFFPAQKGQVTVTLGPLELTGNQTKIILWCLVFVIVKWA